LMTALRLAGVLDGCAGLILGQFRDCGEGPGIENALRLPWRDSTARWSSTFPSVTDRAIWPFPSAPRALRTPTPCAGPPGTLSGLTT
jgi:hypothetical protein